MIKIKYKNFILKVALMAALTSLSGLSFSEREVKDYANIKAKKTEVFKNCTNQKRKVYGKLKLTENNKNNIKEYCSLYTKYSDSVTFAEFEKLHYIYEHTNSLLELFDSISTEERDTYILSLKELLTYSLNKKCSIIPSEDIMTDYAEVYFDILSNYIYLELKKINKTSLSQEELNKKSVSLQNAFANFLKTKHSLDYITNEIIRLKKEEIKENEYSEYYKYLTLNMLINSISLKGASQLKNDKFEKLKENIHLNCGEHI